MSFALYMDVHVPVAITRALRRRGVDVLTAQEDGTSRLPDPLLLDRASALNRVFFTMDRHFLTEAVRRQRAGLPFSSVVYVHPLEASIGRCVDDLDLIGQAVSETEQRDQILFLPL